MIKTDRQCIFISSDNYNGSRLLDNIYNNRYDDYYFDKNQVMILTNLGDDIKFATTYPGFEFMICNKPNTENTKLEDRFKCALNFIKVNNIDDYILILDR